MIGTITQKVIKIGTSKGVTIPSKELKSMGIEVGDEVELVVRKKTQEATGKKVQDTANALLQRYADDFTNLANR